MITIFPGLLERSLRCDNIFWSKLKSQVAKCVCGGERGNDDAQWCAPRLAKERRVVRCLLRQDEGTGRRQTPVGVTAPVPATRAHYARQGEIFREHRDYILLPSQFFPGPSTEVVAVFLYTLSAISLLEYFDGLKLNVYGCNLDIS